MTERILLSILMLCGTAAIVMTTLMLFNPEWRPKNGCNIILDGKVDVTICK